MQSSYHGNHFFETSVFLLSFVVLGKYMEAVAKGHTTSALSRLATLQPKRALLLIFKPEDPVEARRRRRAKRARRCDPSEVE